MSERRLISKPFMTTLGLAVGLSLCLAKGFEAAPQGAAAKPAAATVPSSPPATNEWLTWGYDQERTGWNKAENVLSKDNVSQLTLKWKTQLPTAPALMVLATLTTPLVATVTTPQGPVSRVFVVGSDNTVYAVDAGTGAISWQRKFPNTLTPPVPGDYRCPNTQNATPVIDKEAGIIYVSTSDGKLRGLGLVNGEDRMPTTDFTHPFSRNWSLNLIDGVIYSPTARGCMGVPSHFTALDLKNGRRQEVFTGTGRWAGAWGRGGLVRGPKFIYTQTADGPFDPAAGKFGNSVMALTFKDLRLVDTYTPENWEYVNEKDLDLASTSPLTFPFQKWTLVASVAKEAVVSLLDGDNLGGASHQTPLYTSPRWGNDEALSHDRGVWGAMATWQDAQGRRFLAMSMLGPVGKNAPAFRYTYGPTVDGSIMVLEVRLDPATSKPMLAPVWVSREMHASDVPIVANGVVYALDSGKNSTETRAAGGQTGPGTSFEGAPPPMPARGAGAGRGAGAAGGGPGAKPEPPSRATNAFLYALDAETGKELFRGELESFNHFVSPVVAGGTVYVVDWDGKLYAFGLKK